MFVSFSLALERENAMNESEPICSWFRFATWLVGIPHTSFFNQSQGSANGRKSPKMDWGGYELRRQKEPWKRNSIYGASIFCVSNCFYWSSEKGPQKLARISAKIRWLVNNLSSDDSEFCTHSFSRITIIKRLLVSLSAKSTSFLVNSTPCVFNSVGSAAVN